MPVCCTGVEILNHVHWFPPGRWKMPIDAPNKIISFGYPKSCCGRDLPSDPKPINTRGDMEVVCTECHRHFRYDVGMRWWTVDSEPRKSR